ncbi:hypothetical protein BT93_L3409 [Corymbia citriodora subsp. variegata]|uniref:Uncharacterized protein n=1 Tax=Corymbia citriodora subsp. variegata TaxID=360336 RepID=A0A8T0CH84_CORYI|nr:hypothetical protein BT93_L3409 [Corymbia citriodora subsp. variegata]
MDYSGGRNRLNQFADKTPQNQAMENRESYQTVNSWNQLGFDQKKVAVQKEMKRMNQLPANSTYATHRLKVLNKVLQLLTVQRTASQDEELELLFASLSL